MLLWLLRHRCWCYFHPLPLRFCGTEADFQQLSLGELALSEAVGDLLYDEDYSLLWFNFVGHATLKQIISFGICTKTMDRVEGVL